MQDEMEEEWSKLMCHAWSKKRKMALAAELMFLIYKNENYDFSLVDNASMAQIYQFKTLINKLFDKGNLGQVYLDMNKNPFAINLE